MHPGDTTDNSGRTNKFTRPQRLQDLKHALSLLPPRVGCNEGFGRA
jgi:hypothetical protein